MRRQMVYILRMPAYPHIERYHAEKQRYIDFGGSDNEQSIRRAFANCLDAYCRDHKEKLALIDELGASLGNRPDGTVKDSLRMDRGYWEAKDTHDDLDSEIQRKFNRGYPRDNIIFEDSRTAVLIQNSEEAMRVDMSRPGELNRLIRSFLDYELPEIEEFRQAQQQFKADLPTVIGNLRESVEWAEVNNPEYQEAAAAFLELCKQSIGPAVSAADIREMLLQHILTKDIFLRVFGEDQFHRENNVASQLEALEQTFFTGDVRRQAIDRLHTYYGAIGRAADEIADYAEKQQFLKAIYEDFYKSYNPAAADRLGVVYTPNEVVDFIIRGADHLLQKHFNRRLADDNVQILDPATGTGTFVTNLISYLAGSGEPDALERLERKYRHEIHANEVAILPYYIANLNIEYTYREKTGRYLEFPNLCFVDTLDNMDWQGATGGAVARQGSFNLGGVSTENWMRVQLQNEKTISVIIGNPPYNANQQNYNDNNKNREYPEIDKRIRDTYVASSRAQKHKQNDMYKRFIRWASDRLADDGIIAFITNRAYIDAYQDDGFRQVAGEEFTDIYLLDLGSNVRRNPKISGTTHNVFGIQTGVAMGFLVRDKSKLGGCSIHYAWREDAELAKDKLTYLRAAKLDEIAFEDIMPDSKSNWLNQSSNGFDSLLPLANRETKSAKNAIEVQAIFGFHSLGVSTNRDDWVYAFDVLSLREKALFFANTFNESLDDDGLSFDSPIKWSASILDHFRRGRRIVFSESNLLKSAYRPFVIKEYYANFLMSDRLTRNHYVMFGADLLKPNKVINFSEKSEHFHTVVTKCPTDLHFTGDTRCLPLYRYTEKGERVSNITEWGIKRINDHYNKEWGKDFETIYPDGITAEHIFAYTYAVLHDPVYRDKYAVDLTREFPRLPLYHDFDLWAKMGQDLLDLHIGFETAEPFPLERVDKPGDAKRVVLMPDKERGSIALDDKTTLTRVPPDAWRYQLGSRSALEWVLDQYKEKKIEDPTIAEKFNTYRFADYKERVIDLLRRVCTVSVRTMEIVDSMARLDDEGKLVALGDRDKRE